VSRARLQPSVPWAGALPMSRHPPALSLDLYLRESRRMDTSALLIIPLFAVYEAALVGLTSARTRNAAEVLMKRILGLEGGGPALVLNSALLVVFLVVALRGRRPARAVLPFALLEAAAYAFLLAPLIRGVGALLGPLPQEPGRLAGVILGLGAGLYEEVLFRLVGVAGLALLLRRVLRCDEIWAVATAVLLSALLFSAYHHVGPGGEAWSGSRFVFRFLAGILLGWLYWWRGLGITAWTHGLYDVLLVLQGRA
jgi:membrane protease YdiL (CAAX protease family)